ncbi:CPBP family intramembrane metalloprotease [Paracoccus seriniphilus]|uniref:CPBP family intramembrane metalloprotease n=1 Tax=Paracoccus seriniphilus TaxID=184748 RepID=UPI001FE7D201|nr:CPBP family intramembrane metalloprotease [Paracoccus seriniphilus]
MALETSERRRGAAGFVAFLSITFAITWGVIGSYIIWPEAMATRFGEISGSHPFYFLATWAPAISAVVLVLALFGISGLRGLLSRLLMWRCPPGYWAFILVVIPLVFIAGSLIKGGPLLTPLPPEGVGPMVAAMVMMLFLGLIGNITLAILVTPIFNAARGSLLLSMLFHWQLINPFWPDAQPWDSWILVGVAAAVVWWNRKTMFSREGAVTEIILREARS